MFLIDHKEVLARFPSNFDGPILTVIPVGAIENTTHFVGNIWLEASQPAKHRYDKLIHSPVPGQWSFAQRAGGEAHTRCAGYFIYMCAKGR